jgi:hypothetical protein
MLELIGALTGGLFRLFPEILKFFDMKNERAHELARFDKQLEFQKLTGQQRIEEAIVDADSKFDVSALAALSDAIKGQTQMIGVGWADALNITVRPVVTYVLLGLYVLTKFAMFAIGMNSGLTTWESILQLYTSEDRALLSGILTFWFLNRVLEKVTR